MLLWLLHHLTTSSSGTLAAWAKITPRAALAAGMSFAVAVLLGPRWIAWLRRRFREPIKSASSEIARLHRHKQSPPTMGGLFVVAALCASVLLFGDLGNGYLGPALLVVGGLTLVGAVDDLVKIRSTRNGISAGCKLMAQLAVAGAAAGCSAAPRCTTIFNSSAGPRTRSSSTSGSPPPCVRSWARPRPGWWRPTA